MADVSGYAVKQLVQRKPALVALLGKHLPELLGRGAGGRAAKVPSDGEFARDLVDVFKADDRRAAWLLLALKALDGRRRQPTEALDGIDWNEGVFASFSCAEGGRDILDGRLSGIPRQLSEQCYAIGPRGIHAFALNVMSETRSPRRGSEKDLARLQQLFREMRANCTVRENKTAKEIMEELRAFKDRACKDEPSCVVVCLMSHGRRDRILDEDGAELVLQRVFDEFDAQNCERLRNKPKVFIIQACRGDACDNVETDSVTEVTHRPQKYADMLKVFSSPEDYLALRQPDEGSLLIQELVKVFLENMATTHVMDMLTEVTRRMAARVFKYKGKAVRVVPVVESTLTKRIYLCGTTEEILDPSHLPLLPPPP